MNAGSQPVRIRPTRFTSWLPLLLALLILLAAALVEDYIGNLDMHIYQCYGAAFWGGAKAVQALPVAQCAFLTNPTQFHTLPLEYPPLTLTAFSLPLAGSPMAYPLWFALEMGLITALIYGLLLRYVSYRSAVLFTIGLMTGCLATGLARYDMLPAALTLLCLLLAERRHWSLAYTALAVGVLIKGYPIVLFPLLFLAEQREGGRLITPEHSHTLKEYSAVAFRNIKNFRAWSWKNVLIFTGILAGVTAIFWGVSHTGAFNWLSQHYLRPFEVESTGSALIWLTSLLHVPVDYGTSFGSWNIASPIADVLSQIFVILFEASILFILFQQWRGKMGFFQASLAALLALVGTGKVFSPQYLLWLMPLVAMAGSTNRRLWRLWIWICILTTLIYPVFYGFITYFHLDSHTPGFLPLILVRDGLFIALTVLYFINFRGLREQGTEAVKI